MPRVHDRLLVLFGRQPVGPLEYADEIIDIVISAGCRDRSDREGRRIDQRDRLAHPDLMDKFCERAARLFAEEIGQVCLGDIEHLGKEVEVQVLRVMKINV